MDSVRDLKDGRTDRNFQAGAGEVNISRWETGADKNKRMTTKKKEAARGQQTNIWYLWSCCLHQFCVTQVCSGSMFSSLIQMQMSGFPLNYLTYFERPLWGPNRQISANLRRSPFTQTPLFTKLANTVCLQDLAPRCTLCTYLYPDFLVTQYLAYNKCSSIIFAGAIFEVTDTGSTIIRLTTDISWHS